jgi:hypothetical protein
MSMAPFGHFDSGWSGSGMEPLKLEALVKKSRSTLICVPPQMFCVLGFIPEAQRGLDATITYLVQNIPDGVFKPFLSTVFDSVSTPALKRITHGF